MVSSDIKRIRLSLGWSQETLARKLGVSFCTVNRWENGRTKPSPLAQKILSELKQNAGLSVDRSTKRYQLRCPITVKMAGAKGGVKPLCAVTENVSLGGLMFKTSQLISEGDSLFIDLSLSGKPIRAESEVVWAFGDKAERSIGVSFKKINLKDLAAMRAMLN